jgi:hypothetical protein
MAAGNRNRSGVEEFVVSRAHKGTVFWSRMFLAVSLIIGIPAPFERNIFRSYKELRRRCGSETL